MKSLFSLCIALCLVAPAMATISVEFHLGAIDVPAGSLGVIAADVNGDGFADITSAVGTPLAVGERVGADDVIVAVFSNADLAEWGGRRGFAEQFAVIDYAALGVAPGQELILHVFPDRLADAPVRSGEPHLSYRTDDLGELTANSSMGFALPDDGGAYLLAALGTTEGGSADLAAADIAEFPLSGGVGEVDRSLSPSARHTYFFELAAAGSFTLAGTGAAGLRAELYGPGGLLIAASDGSGSFAFNEDLGTGFHSLVVFRNPAGGGALEYEIELSAAGLRFVRPDVAVGASLTSLGGAGVYSPVAQQVTLTSRRAAPVTGFATVANAGTLPDTLTVRASGGTKLFKVVYTGATGTNMTATLVAGTFRTAGMNDGDTALPIRTTVTPNKRALKKKRGKRTVYLKKSYNTTIRAVADSDPLLNDGAVIRVMTR